MFVFSFTHPHARAVFVHDIIWCSGIGELLSCPSQLKKCGEATHEALKPSQFLSEGLKMCLKKLYLCCLSMQAGGPAASSSVGWIREGSGVPVSPPSRLSLPVKRVDSFLLESVAFEDTQPVVLEDGSMAYIHNTAKGEEHSLFLPWQLEQKLTDLQGCW